MPRPAEARAPAAPITIELAPDEARALVDAIGLAIDHYTRKAEERRRLAEHGMTIGTRRQAQHDAIDLTAHARRLDALRTAIYPR